MRSKLEESLAVEEVGPQQNPVSRGGDFIVGGNDGDFEEGLREKHPGQ